MLKRKGLSGRCMVSLLEVRDRYYCLSDSDGFYFYIENILREVVSF